MGHESGIGEGVRGCSSTTFCEDSPVAETSAAAYTSLDRE